MKVTTVPTHQAAPQPRLFDPLERADFQQLEHASYLKGLLRPFKGREDLELWARQCVTARDCLIALEQRVLSQANSYPFNLLPVVLAQQTTGSGTVFLRWRNSDRSAMGMSLWEKAIDHPGTPLALLPDLLAIELQRVTLNKQVSAVHTLARLAQDCAAKMSAAETIYQRRASRHAHSTAKESVE